MRENEPLDRLLDEWTTLDSEVNSIEFLPIRSRADFDRKVADLRRRIAGFQDPEIKEVLSDMLQTFLDGVIGIERGP